jgi:hypothetical protein
LRQQRHLHIAIAVRQGHRLLVDEVLEDEEHDALEQQDQQDEQGKARPFPERRLPVDVDQG